MKVGPSAKRRCPKCIVVIRHRRNGKRVVRIQCKANPKHKARQP